MAASADLNMAECFDVTTSAGFLSPGLPCMLCCCNAEGVPGDGPKSSARGACLLRAIVLLGSVLSRRHIRGSSFCFLNAGTSGRHGFLLPQGVGSQPSVQVANRIASRTAALCEIGIHLGLHVCVEQPAHPRGLIALQPWQRLCARYQMFRARCLQGAYAADTKKPTVLYANHLKWAFMKNRLANEDANRLKQRGKVLATKKRNSNGELKLTGVKGALKSTQSYTKAFGRAIVDAWSVGACVPWPSKKHVFQPQDAVDGFECKACSEGLPPPLFENLNENGYEEEPLKRFPLVLAWRFCWNFTDFYGFLRIFTFFTDLYMLHGRSH